MKKATKILFTTLCIPFLCLSFFLGWMAIQGEGYNPINPLIDTVFTEKFSEEKFNSIQVGNSSEYVTSLIGEPLSRRETKKNIDIWYYSLDSKCEWGDFAWISYCVQFDKNCNVIKTYHYIAYD